MEIYFRKNKEAKLYLIKLIIRLQKERNLDGNKLTDELEKMASNVDNYDEIENFNLNNIKNEEYKNYISNLLQINKDNITKEELYDIFSKIKNEKQKDIDYKSEYLNALLGIMYMCEELYKYEIDNETMKKYPFAKEYEKNGKAVVYFNFDEQLGNDIFKLLNFNTNKIFISEEEFENKKQEINDEIKKGISL